MYGMPEVKLLIGCGGFTAYLKTAMYEVMYMADEVPTGAAVNEAVELAKKYEEPETVPFINGILGSFSREEAADK